MKIPVTCERVSRGNNTHFRGVITVGMAVVNFETFYPFGGENFELTLETDHCLAVITEPVHVCVSALQPKERNVVMFLGGIVRKVVSLVAGDTGHGVVLLQRSGDVAGVCEKGDPKISLNLEEEDCPEALHVVEEWARGELTSEVPA